MSVSSEWVSVIIASASLLLSISLAAFYVRDRRRAAFAIENDYSNELLRWHADVVDTLQSLRLACPSPEERLGRLAHLSALIERGRFFFPNVDHGDAFGEEKPPAYRGYRNLALDFLVAAYNLLSAPLTPSAASTIETLQRHFTSIVFEVVRPQQRLDAIRSMTDRYFAQEKSFDDFIDHPDGDAIRAIWRPPA